MLRIQTDFYIYGLEFGETDMIWRKSSIKYVIEGQELRENHPFFENPAGGTDSMKAFVPGSVVEEIEE